MAKNTAKKTSTPKSTKEELTPDELAFSKSNNNEIVEIDWEKVEPVFEFKQRLSNLETYFSNMCLQFEKNKANLMSQIMYGQSDLYSMAQGLQRELNVDENLTYELKLPTVHGEKGYFVRKDDSN